MKRLKCAFLTLFAVCAGASPSFAGGTVNTFTLSNGLTVLHTQVTKHPLVAVELFLRSGTINETEKEAGLANFVNALLLQGTSLRSAEQIAQEMEDAGLGISVDTEHDYSTIVASSLDESAEKAFDILSDVTRNPSFPADEIEKERQNTLAAIESNKDSIFNVANDLFNSTFYGSHPYAWPDLGRAETVSRFKREDLVRWHKDHFRASNLLLVVAGNIDLDRAKQLAEKYFKDVPDHAKTAAAPRPALPEAAKKTELTPKFKQAFLMVGFPAPSIAGADFPSLKVMNALLGGRMSGRLFIELREKLSLGYEVSSFYPTRTELSRFVVYLGLEAKNTDKARARIFELLNELKERPVSDKELADTVSFIRGVYLLDHQTIARQAWYLGWWEVMGKGYAYDDLYLDDLAKVTPESLQKVARQYFTDRVIQVDLVPGKK